MKNILQDKMSEMGRGSRERKRTDREEIRKQMGQKKIMSRTWESVYRSFLY
jgi:hypothetical protein